MKKENVFSLLAYIFGPVILYIFVSELVSGAMDFAWNDFLQEMIVQGTGMADSRTALPVWSFLRLVLPASAGCLTVRRLARLEWQYFSAAQKKRRLLFSHKGKKEGFEDKKNYILWSSIYAAAGAEIRKRVSALFLSAAVFLALGINVVCSVLMPEQVSGSAPVNLPGFTGFVLQVLIYCFFMPFIEETVFRGILYPRLQRWYGTGAAVLASAFFFGLYHGHFPQAIYAMIMGALFAAAYEATGSFMVPCSLHGACNLSILFLQWTGVYSSVCRPEWGAAFLGIAAGGFLTICMIIKKTAG